MSFQDAVRSAPRAGGARGLLRWVCTNNPFYVISAGLFLAGLRMSFGGQPEAIDTWFLMAGLTGYTLLLAATACVLGRFARVWDDMRTVLLLVVLMFLATSVTFDEVLVLEPDRGIDCYLLGLGFAVVVSEVLLRTIRLWLPDGFKVPYYLSLALFFLYPIGLSPLVSDPHDETLMWAIFGFSSVAGVIVLTLLPAVHRGPDYSAENGSPWPWPWYPWTLFGVLGLAVPARAFLLCVSMQIADGPDEKGGVMFGPYFLVPFGLAVALLLLHIGLRSGSRRAVGVALAMPLGLVALTLVGHNDARIYREFLDVFRERLGAGPLYLALVLAAGFYTYASLRGVRPALEGLSAALVALAFVEPTALDLSGPRLLEPVPILLASMLQLGIGIHRRQTLRCLLGGIGVALLVTMFVPVEFLGDIPREAIAFHLVLLTILAVGAWAEGWFGQLLRDFGAIATLAACAAAMFLRPELPPSIEPWMVQVYPVVLASLLAAYGLQFEHRASVVVAGMIGFCCLTRGTIWGYVWLRQRVAGLDYLALSLGVFAIAVGISLGKSGMMRQWLTKREEVIEATES